MGDRGMTPSNMPLPDLPDHYSGRPRQVRQIGVVLARPRVRADYPHLVFPDRRSGNNQGWNITTRARDGGSACADRSRVGGSRTGRRGTLR